MTQRLQESETDERDENARGCSGKRQIKPLEEKMGYL